MTDDKAARIAELERILANMRSPDDFDFWPARARLEARINEIREEIDNLSRHEPRR